MPSVLIVLWGRTHPRIYGIHATSPHFAYLTPVFNRGHDEPVGGEVVADPAVDVPGAAEAVREDDERPPPRAVRRSVLDDGDVHGAVHHPARSGKLRHSHGIKVSRKLRFLMF